ncbi:MAG: class I SAM-dependent methyltransferase [Bacilli bacterium]|nr:class I SAM-dependent methyltransferase [Bacilli bacterium]
MKKDKIKDSYHSSKDIYDSVLTQDKWWSKLYIRLFWSGVDDKEIAKKVLNYIPNDFNGTLLDVPVGTGVFTLPKYTLLTNAKIYGLDYSNDMLKKAKEKFSSLNNVTLMQGDVGKLPFPDKNFDIVMSMNGFHAFPDIDKAYEEIFRVLKSNGLFIACYYIKGESIVTDSLVNLFLSKKGWFTPPFETSDMVKSRLEKMYTDIEMQCEGSMIYFKARKK